MKCSGEISHNNVIIPALNNHWWDVCVGYMQISERRSVYGFRANFGKEPDSYVYVRRGDSIDTMDEVNENANYIGQY